MSKSKEVTTKQSMNRSFVKGAQTKSDARDTLVTIAEEIKIDIRELLDGATSPEDLQTALKSMHKKYAVELDMEIREYKKFV